ncbi:hypothetical protein ABL78_1868 [Leptomonas seymouri]|uniref:Uncharacterized protein n=1 Tax=Leptomonas seymouri TaxID=5684 RepID=A0A0N1IM64_LEPSE|nr:hypothetical protein ABL78_1868 [Leptomonas seymouri]|eukprot:KPI89055.1 hypothetical protein ABL78_1868 [Leptomonas seymouri]
MGALNSRSKRNEPSNGSSSRHYCRYSSSSHEDIAALAKRGVTERERSSNDYSNDYKIQLMQRKAAMRNDKEQRHTQHPPSSNPEGASRVTEPKEGHHNDGQHGLYTHFRKAPSVVSETSVRTVAHKPIRRQVEDGELTPVVQRPSKMDSAALHRRRWSDVAGGSTRDEPHRGASSGGLLFFFGADASHASSSGWGCEAGGACDSGGGGGCDNSFPM